MSAVTILQALIKEKDLILIPRVQYEDLLRRADQKPNQEVKLTQTQEKRLKTARTNLASGKFLTINDLKRKMGVKN